MDTICRRSLLVASILVAGILIPGCALTPKLAVKVATKPDETGAIKYQLWTGCILVKPVLVREVKEPGDIVEFGLQAVVTRKECEPILLLHGERNFFSSTRLTYKPIDKTKMPEKLTVAVEDKVEKRIQQAGDLLKLAVPLVFAEAPQPPAPAKGADATQKLIQEFKPWALNLAPLLDCVEWKEDEFTLPMNNSNDLPEGWSYTLVLRGASTTAVGIKEKISPSTTSAKKYAVLAEYLDSLGAKGILVYPSCRPAELTLTHMTGGKEDFRWVTQLVIPDPRWVETVKLPCKGSVTFGDCSVAVEPGDQDERDYFAVGAKLAATANEVWQAQKKAKEQN